MLAGAQRMLDGWLAFDYNNDKSSRTQFPLL